MATRDPAPDVTTWTRQRLAALYLASGLLLIAVLAQATLLARVRFFDASANLVLIVLLSWSLLRGPTEGMLWAFVAGLAFDLIAGLPVGTSSLAWMVVCSLAVLGEGSFFQGHVFLPMIAVALATPLYGWLILLTQQLRGLPVDWPGATLRVIVPELLLNVVLIAGVYPLIRWALRRVGCSRYVW